MRQWSDDYTVGCEIYGSAAEPGLFVGNTPGPGVLGDSFTGEGVRGQSTHSTGVVGNSLTANGVAGYANSGGIGVYGESVLGYAGYFSGDVGVSGTLSKAAGSFITMRERAWPRKSNTRQRDLNSLDAKSDHAIVLGSPPDGPTDSRDRHKRTRNWRLSGYDPKADERTIATALNTEPRLAVLSAFELEYPWLHDRAGSSNAPLIVGYAHAGPIIARGIILLSHAVIFSTIWFVVAAVKMWIEVAQAGSSFAEALPLLLLIFLVPAAATTVITWTFF